MTVNKEKWQELSEKYNTKAKWADAILLLSLEEHEDLISALIELDPRDLASVGGAVSSPTLPDVILNLDTSKLPDPSDLVAIIGRELGRERQDK